MHSRVLQLYLLLTSSKVRTVLLTKSPHPWSINAYELALTQNMSSASPNFRQNQLKVEKQNPTPAQPQTLNPMLSPWNLAALNPKP